MSKLDLADADDDAAAAADLSPRWGSGHPPRLSLEGREFDSRTRRYGGLAHLGEREPCMLEVIGSSPISSTNLKPKALFGDAML